MRAGLLLSRQAAGRQARPNCFAPPPSRHHHCILLPNELDPLPRPISPSPSPSPLLYPHSCNAIIAASPARTDSTSASSSRAQTPSCGKSTRDSLALAHDSRHYCSLCTRIAGSQLWIQPRRFAQACEWTHNRTIPPFFLLELHR
jgi:hypothetical protein